MARWRVSYQTSNGTQEQITIQVEGDQSAGKIREMIMSGDGHTYVSRDTILAIEHMEN